jgi:phosphatidylserine decarboxylase
MSRLFVILQYLLPHHGLSRLVAMLANSRWSLIKNPFIYLFMRHFKVDLSESVTGDYRQFENFNAFFTRSLLEGVRPLQGGDQAIVSPADGAISQLGKLQDNLLLQAKGISYSAVDLLGGLAHDAEEFRNGSFVTVYLSPRDYHRVHMPIAGTLRSTVYVPGRLFSVNQRTTERVNGLFTRNERLVCLFDTPAGPMALIMVGAMIVAGIETVWGGQACPNQHGRLRTDFSEQSPPITLDKGAEMGRFKLGSTVILLFGTDAVELENEIQPDNQIKLGEALAAPARRNNYGPE